MRAQSIVLIVCLTSLCLSLAGCAAAAAPPTPTAAPLAQPTLIDPTPTQVPELITKSAPFKSKNSKLSSRLVILMNNPALATASQAEQSRAFSLPPSGAGSLRFDKQGRVQVNIRVKDVADATMQTLKNAGVEVMHVSEQYLTISAYVSPLDLAAIAALPQVIGLDEELTPQLNDGAGS
jgi:hypothetical protein